MLSEKERVMNFLRFASKPGDRTWRDENSRCVVRLSCEADTMPICRLYKHWDEEKETGDWVGDTLVESAVDFLFGEEFMVFYK